MKNLIIRICCCVALLFGAAGCGSENKTSISLTQSGLQGVKKIAVVVEQKNDFEVIHYRATTNYRVAYFAGGLAGDAIAHGVDKDKDKKEALPMIKAVEDVCCSSIFIESLAPLFEPNRTDRVYILTNTNPKQKTNLSEYDAVLTFTIDRWGLRLIELGTEKLAGFVKVYAKMVNTKDKKIIWKQKELIIGERRETVSTYTTNSEMLRNEMRETIKKTGFQMANALMFPADPN